MEQALRALCDRLLADVDCRGWVRLANLAEHLGLVAVAVAASPAGGTDASAPFTPPASALFSAPWTPPEPASRTVSFGEADVRQFEVHGDLQPTKWLHRSPPSPSSLPASGSDMGACFLLADAPASPLAQPDLAALFSALSLSIGNFAQCVNTDFWWTHVHTYTHMDAGNLAMCLRLVIASGRVAVVVVVVVVCVYSYLWNLFTCLQDVVFCSRASYLCKDNDARVYMKLLSAVSTHEQP